MDELSVSDCLAGLNSKDVFDGATKLLVVEILANKVVDEVETLTEGETQELSKHFVSKLFSARFNEKPEVINLYLGLLSNLTQTEASCEVFSTLFAKDREFNGQFNKVIEVYLSFNPQTEVENMGSGSSTEEKWIESDPYQHMGSLLCNLCQIESGREIILKPSTGYMEKIAIQIRSQNITRRRAALSCVRSCLFDKEIHWFMLYEAKVLTPLVYSMVPNIPFTEKEKENMDPLLWMSAENIDKTIEPEKDLLRMMIDCLLLMCQRRGIREELRRRRLYPIIKNLDNTVKESEDFANINEGIYEIVNYLIGNEDPDVPVDTYEEHCSSKSGDIATHVSSTSTEPSEPTETHPTIDEQCLDEMD